MTSVISDQFFQSDNLAYLPMLQQDLLQHQRFNVAAQVTKAYLTTSNHTSAERSLVVLYTQHHLEPLEGGLQPPMRYRGRWSGLECLQVVS